MEWEEREGRRESFSFNCNFVFNDSIDEQMAREGRGTAEHELKNGERRAMGPHSRRLLRFEVDEGIPLILHEGFTTLLERSSSHYGTICNEHC